MSYTNGGQTIDKSMNGIISVDAETVTAENIIATNITATNVTATDIITDNITCETATVNTELKASGQTLISPNLGLQFDTSNNELVGIFRNITGASSNLAFYNDTVSPEFTFYTGAFVPAMTITDAKVTAPLLLECNTLAVNTELKASGQTLISPNLGLQFDTSNNELVGIFRNITGASSNLSFYNDTATPSFTFYTGAFVPAMTITDAKVTAPLLLECSTLAVSSTSTFNGALPTSTITTSTNDNQFITRGIGNSLYASGSILGSNNTWTGQNYYNTILPSSTLTGTPTATQIAPVSMLNNLYASLVAGGYARLTSVLNTFTNNNIFQGTLSCTSTATLATLQTLFISWSTTSGDIVEQTFNTATGVFKFLSYVLGTTPRFDFAFIPVATEVVVFRIQQATSTFFNNLAINGSTLSVSGSTATTFVNLPSTTTTFTTATANQFITRSIGDAIYPAVPTGGYARLTTVANTFTNNNTFDGAINTFTQLPRCPVTVAPTSNDEICPVAVLDLRYPALPAGGFARLTTVANTFTNNNTFDGAINTFTELPRCPVTVAPTINSEICPVGVLDLRYQPLATGGFARLTTVANAFTNNNSFSVLPTSSVTTAITNTNQIAPVASLDLRYSSLPTGGFARLTTVNNTFTNNNTFNGAINTFTQLPRCPVTVLPTRNDEICPVTVLDLRFAQLVTGGYARLTTVNNAFTNSNTFNTTLPTSTITTTTTTTQIAPIAVLNNLFGRLATSVTNTWASANVFNAVLPTSTIATSSSVSQFITRTIANIYYGQLSTVNTWTTGQTFNAPIAVVHPAGTPTFTNSQIGFKFSSKPPSNSGNTATANTVYAIQQFGIPTAGSWRVDAYVTVNLALQGRFDLSIGSGVIPLVHEFEKVSAYAFQDNIARPFSMMASITHLYELGEVVTVKISSTDAQAITPIVASTYSSVYVITRLG